MNEFKILKLIKNIKKGDENAFLQVIDLYSPLLKTIINNKLYFLTSEKEEVLNDVLLKIWNNIDSFDPNKGTFENWICAIASYESINRIRKEYLKNELELNEDIISSESNPEEKVLQKELYKEILSLLDSLKDQDKEIFLDLFFEGMTYEDISEKYGIKISNLYNIVSRNRKLLKKTFEEGKI